MYYTNNDRPTLYNGPKPIAVPTDEIAPMHVVEKHYAQNAHCQHCDWRSKTGTVGSIKHHVLTHPGHEIVATWTAVETFRAQGAFEKRQPK